jgi:hypothetical protein
VAAEGDSGVHSPGARLPDTTAGPPPVASKRGPPPGFGKAVNDYLNHYVTLADAKAAGLLIAALTLAPWLMQFEVKSGIAWVGRGIALAALAAAVGAAAVVLFPRLPFGRTGPIFWEDILGRQSAASYERELRTLDEADVEAAYAQQNYAVSGVLHKKFKVVQASIVMLLIAAAAGALSYLFRG